MAALERRPQGMKMSELSSFLMVSNGNVTGIIDRLVEERLVTRQAPENDRRAIIVRLTPKGAKQFGVMAEAHQGWVDKLLSEFNAAEADVLIRHLDGLSGRIRNGGSRCMNMADYKPEHFNWRVDGKVATITLNRPEKKNPITFESYAELGRTFRELERAEDIKAIVFGSNGGNFCSGGDVHDIIGPLIKRTAQGQLEFTRMTGELIKAMRACPQPIIAAIDGVCVGAGAMIALFSDLRLGTPQAKTAFLFTRVGLAGCDMGACAMLPRVIGHGRASELLYTGRTMNAEEGERWGFFNKLVAADQLDKEAATLAQSLAAGPTFAHGMTKKMLHQEWSMSLDDAIEAEAVAQAVCMQTKDFARAYEAFVAKQKPVFAGN